MGSTSAIPEALAELLEGAGSAVASGEVPTALSACLAGLGALPAQAVGRLEGEIASLLGLIA